MARPSDDATPPSAATWRHAVRAARLLSRPVSTAAAHMRPKVNNTSRAAAQLLRSALGRHRHLSVAEPSREPQTAQVLNVSAGSASPRRGAAVGWSAGGRGASLPSSTQREKLPAGSGVWPAPRGSSYSASAAQKGELPKGSGIRPIPRGSFGGPRSTNLPHSTTCPVAAPRGRILAY